MNVTLHRTEFERRSFLELLALPEPDEAPLLDPFLEVEMPEPFPVKLYQGLTGKSPYTPAWRRNEGDPRKPFRCFFFAKSPRARLAVQSPQKTCLVVRLPGITTLGYIDNGERAAQAVHAWAQKLTRAVPDALAGRRATSDEALRANAQVDSRFQVDLADQVVRAGTNTRAVELF
jgi:hypothetical protein